MTPVMYTDMTETQFVKWNLEYTEPYLLETFQSIPADKLLAPPVPGMETPAMIFANSIVKEAIHTQGFNQGRIELPAKYRCLLGWQGASTEEKLAAVADRDGLIALFKQVRKATYAYLDSLTDEELKRVPTKSILKEGDPNRGNPVREAFVMTIYQQNVCWGKLMAIKQMLGLPPTDPEKWQK